MNYFNSIEDIKKIPAWLHNQVFRKADWLYSSQDDFDYDTPIVECLPHQSNLMCSDNKGYWNEHLLMLDLDTEHYYAESSTPGHAHLVFRKPMEPAAVREVLQVLAKYGIVQHGYAESFDRLGYSSLRTPGERKGDTPERPPLEQRLSPDHLLEVKLAENRDKMAALVKERAELEVQQTKDWF